MNIVGIETTTEHLSAALLTENAVFERHFDSRSSHCELLTRFITECTDEAGIAMDDINGIAVSLGPGSFTGLRIGIATAMGLAYGLGIESVGINTLAALALNVGAPSTLVCPLIDARRSEVYTALYRTTDGMPDIVIEPVAMPVANLAEILAARHDPITIAGPAAEKFHDSFKDISDITLAPLEATKPSAISIAQLGRILFRSGQSVSPIALQPIYLRASDAEIMRDQNCK